VIELMVFMLSSQLGIYFVKQYADKRKDWQFKVKVIK